MARQRFYIKGKFRRPVDTSGGEVMLYESDRTVTMDEIRENCECNDRDVPEEGSRAYWDEVCHAREFDFDDFLGNLKYSTATADRYVITGYFGGWRGTRSIVPSVVPTSDWREFWAKFAVSSSFEMHVGYDKDGLFVKIFHHDGTCLYRIREMNRRGENYLARCAERGEDPVELGSDKYSYPVTYWLY